MNSTDKVLTTEEICTILGMCRGLGLSKLSFNGLVLEFHEPRAENHQPVYLDPQSEPSSIAKDSEVREKPSLVTETNPIKELEQAEADSDLMLEDPAKYEETVALRIFNGTEET